MGSTISVIQTQTETYSLLVMLMDLLQQHRSLLVLAAFVLEPDADHSRTQSSHLDELLLHQSVRSRVGAVAGAQRVKLFLVQHGPDPRRLLVALVRPRRAAGGPRVTAADHRQRHRLQDDCATSPVKTVTSGGVSGEKKNPSS